MTATPFGDQMRALAVDHPRHDELIQRADEFEAAVAGFYATPQTVDAKRFLGCWARARRIYCDITGEPPI